MSGNQNSRNGSRVELFESFDDELPCIEFVVVIDFFFRKKSRDRNGAEQCIGVRRTVARDLAASLSKRCRKFTVRMSRPSNRGKSFIEFDVRGSVG